MCNLITCFRHYLGRTFPCLLLWQLVFCCQKSIFTWLSCHFQACYKRFFWPDKRLFFIWIFHTPVWFDNKFCFGPFPLIADNYNMVPPCTIFLQFVITTQKSGCVLISLCLKAFPIRWQSLCWWYLETILIFSVGLQSNAFHSIFFA